MTYRGTSNISRSVTRPGGASSSRRVSQPSSLSSRFQAVHEQRRAPVSRASSRPGAGKSSRRGRARQAIAGASSRMDIDQGSRGSRPRGGSPRHQGRGSFRGGRGGRGGRGDRRGGRGGSRGGRGGGGGDRANRMPADKDKLDMDLDNYMMGDSKAGKSILDNDLESYMQHAA